MNGKALDDEALNQVSGGVCILVNKNENGNHTANSNLGKKSAILDDILIGSDNSDF